MSGVYRCNCDQEFPSHLARVAHAASCLVMQRALCVICQSGRVSEGDVQADIRAHLRHAVTGGSTPNPTEATRSNAKSHKQSCMAKRFDEGVCTCGVSDV